VTILPTRLAPARLIDRLRAQEPPVIARIEADRAVLDPRTVLPDEDEPLLRAVIAAVR
jgi:L-seryl-tRNA(Ser) seleniumtransferase